MEAGTFTPHVRIERKASVKGEIYWDISVSLPAERADEIPALIKRLDERMKELYP